MTSLLDILCLSRADYSTPLDAEIDEAVALYEHRLGRPMTAIERAAVEETERDCRLRHTLHQLRLAALSPRERRYRGIRP